jgi:hypothetical protein
VRRHALRFVNDQGAIHLCHRKPAYDF